MRSVNPLSPSTTFNFAFAATFSKTSSSRRRMSVGLSWSSLAVLAWLRMAAVSSRRTIRLASAAFLASVTLFKSAHVALLDREHLQHPLGQRRTGDDLQLTVDEADARDVDDLDLHVAQRRPIGVE